MSALPLVRGSLEQHTTVDSPEYEVICYESSMPLLHLQLEALCCPPMWSTWCHEAEPSLCSTQDRRSCSCKTDLSQDLSIFTLQLKWMYNYQTYRNIYKNDKSFLILHLFYCFDSSLCGRHHHMTNCLSIFEIDTVTAIPTSFAWYAKCFLSNQHVGHSSLPLEATHTIW